MTNEELETRINKLQADAQDALTRLREYRRNGEKYKQEALDELNADILSYVQISISEMRVLEAELEAATDE